MINPQPGAAVYMQLAARLRADILTGRLEPGQKIPSETALQQTYGVARDTARRAIAVLRAEGLVVVQRGHGTLVRDHHAMQELNPAPGSTVTARMPTPEERADQDIDEGIPVLVVTGADGRVSVHPGDRWMLRLP
jgi:DNA-binding FadR family transcriptional regulator